MRGLRSFRSFAIVLCVGALVLSAAGCASKQRLDLHCVPRTVTVYVDGRMLEEVPEELALRTDQPHTVFFKGGGYKNQMVVLESQEDGETRVLQPADLCSQTTFVSMRPDLQLEAEEPEPAPTD
jgi:hypothetical protein